jgi:Acyclic terpene utilisation family protein AtuA
MNGPDPRPVRIANCSGFYGDRLSAALEMVSGGPVDVLTGDWLAELTMGILHRQRVHDGDRGYAHSFVDQMEQVLELCLERGISVVSNAGGANPAACARAVEEVARRLSLSVSVVVVDGDDVTTEVAARLRAGEAAPHMSTGRPFSDLGADLLGANAYLGAWGIVEALDAGADVVVTGRVTDASVAVAPAAHRFGWRRDDWDRLAGAVIAGHVIECGAQATGGNFSFFRELPNLRRPGFPIAEVHADGSSVITKHVGTGGAVTVDTVTAQLLYESDGPLYNNPDVVARLDTVELRQVGPDRVELSGIRGEPAPAQVKVGLVAAPGWRSTILLGMAGRDIPAKTALAVDAICDAIPGGADAFDDMKIERIGQECPDPASMEQSVCALSVSVADRDRAAVDRFTRAAVETSLASYPGFFLLSPPGAARKYTVFWPVLMPAKDFMQRVTVGGRSWPVGPPAACAAPARDLPPVTQWQPSASGPDKDAAAGERRVVPLRDLLGARSGDKAGDATLGLWARDDATYRWLREWFDPETLRTLVPEFDGLELRPWILPRIRAVGVTVVGYLGHGVGANLALDPQAKSLGEYVLAHEVTMPLQLLTGQEAPHD